MTHSIPPAAAASPADVPAVRDRRRAAQPVELVGTISGVNVAEGTVVLADGQDGRRIHPELTVRLTDEPTITVNGQRRPLSEVPVGEKLLVTGILDGTVLTSGEIHALTLAGWPAR